MSGRVWAGICALALLVAGILTVLAMPADAAEPIPQVNWLDQP